MQKLLPGLLTLLILTGCGTTPVSSESTREVVHAYLGADVGTAGPFFKGAKNEIDVLSDADRRQVEALVDRGAAVFLVFAGRGAGAAQTGGASRVIVVQDGRVVGDFHAQPKPTAP